MRKKLLMVGISLLMCCAWVGAQETGKNELQQRAESEYAKGNPIAARTEIDDLIDIYKKSSYEMFRDFANLLEKYKDPIINSFIMVEKIGNGKIYDSRLSNGPIESINRKVKDLKRLGRGFRNFEHFRNRFLYATRSAPVLNGVSDYNPVTYFEEDEF